MENISSIGSNYISQVQEMLKTNAFTSANAGMVKASNDILDILTDGTFMVDEDVPENSTFSLHV